MGVEVNESWGNNRAVGIDDLVGYAVGPAPYAGNATVFDPHVASESRHPCSIDDGAVFYVNVVVSSHGSPRSGLRSGVMLNQPSTPLLWNRV